MKKNYKISIIVPAFNEEKTICKILSKIASQRNQGEIILVDDGSIDNTFDEAQKWKKKHPSINLKIIQHKFNVGKGAAIATGLKIATCEIILIQDADLEYDPKNYKKILSPFSENGADIVYGSRFCAGESHRVLLFWHYIGNKILTFLCNMVSDLNLTDVEYGLKAFRKKIISEVVLQEKRFGFEPEIVIKLSDKALKIFEVGVSYFGRSYSQGKKITWKDGISAIRCIIIYGVLVNLNKR